MAVLNTEQIIYLARKLHWGREEIGKLHPSQAVEIFNELTYQESVEEWRMQHNVASLLAAIYNTIPTKSHKGFQTGDFFSTEMPRRITDKRKGEVDEMANEAGITLPTK